MDDELARLRQRIDAIDDRILELVSERARLAQEIGHLKNAGSSTFSFTRYTAMASKGTMRFSRTLRTESVSSRLSDVPRSCASSNSSWASCRAAAIWLRNSG